MWNGTGGVTVDDDVVTVLGSLSCVMGDSGTG